MTDPIRIVLVDDQALFRAGIRMLLNSQTDMDVVGEAGDGREGVAVVTATRPDVVLMDIRMPVMDGIAATAELLRDPGAPRIVMLTTFDLDEAAARAIRQGASGFLLKDADPEFLLAAVRSVHSGSEVIAASATRELFAHFAAPVKPVAARIRCSDGARARDLHVCRARYEQLGDRGAGVPERGDREDARQSSAHEARPARPSAARRVRARARSGLMHADAMTTGAPRADIRGICRCATRHHPPG